MMIEVRTFVRLIWAIGAAFAMSISLLIPTLGYLIHSFFWRSTGIHFRLDVTLVALGAGIGIVVLFLVKRTISRGMRALSQRWTLRKLATDARNMHFQIAVENMRHGLSMFDADGKMIICNSIYIDLYNLDPNVIVPGVSIEEIFEQRSRNGAAPKMSAISSSGSLESTRNAQDGAAEFELENGSFVSIDRRMMPDGGWVSVHIDITEKKAAETRLSYMAYHDALTGLANRRQLLEYFRRSLNRTKRGDCLAALCLDIDHFKTINDSLGHSFGDKLLCAVADRISSVTRGYDMVARLGGDEFFVLQVAQKQPESATALAQRIIDVTGKPFEIDGHSVVIGTSIGISLAPLDGEDVETLFKSADMAMYQSKSKGRGRFSFFEQIMDVKARERHQLERDLRNAISMKEFEIYYQPIVNIKEDRISGFEALLRWNHPIRGLVPPDQFIPLAEETGLIVPIGEWVIKQACFETKKWGSNLNIAINLSPVQFRGTGLVSSVISALVESGLDAKFLELEITEAVLLQDTEHTVNILAKLKSLGIRIAVDDFGIGYSSLSYLQKFPFDKIKVDRSFIRELHNKPQSIAIIRAVTGLSRSLNMTTTAEGIETNEQLEQMIAEGCVEAQGFLFGRPQNASEVTACLRDFRSIAARAA